MKTVASPTAADLCSIAQTVFGSGAGNGPGTWVKNAEGHFELGVQTDAALEWALLLWCRAHRVAMSAPATMARLEEEFRKRTTEAKATRLRDRADARLVSLDDAAREFLGLRGKRPSRMLRRTLQQMISARILEDDAESALKRGKTTRGFAKVIADLHREGALQAISAGK